MKVHKLFLERVIFKKVTLCEQGLTHSVAVTVSEPEMTEFPPLKLTETSRVLKENAETTIKSN